MSASVPDHATLPPPTSSHTTLWNISVTNPLYVLPYCFNICTQSLYAGMASTSQASYSRLWRSVSGVVGTLHLLLSSSKSELLQPR